MLLASYVHPSSCLLESATVSCGRGMSDARRRRSVVVSTDIGSDLSVVNPDGTGLKRLLSVTDLGGYATSPDGKRLAYDDRGAGAVLLGPMHDGSKPLVVLKSSSGDVPEDPVWRPEQGTPTTAWVT